MDIGFYMEYIEAPAKVLIWDPCPLGQPVRLAVAHVMPGKPLRLSQLRLRLGSSRGLANSRLPNKDY